MVYFHTFAVLKSEFLQTSCCPSRHHVSWMPWHLNIGISNGPLSSCETLQEGDTPSNSFWIIKPMPLIVLYINRKLYWQKFSRCWPVPEAKACDELLECYCLHVKTRKSATCAWCHRHQNLSSKKSNQQMWKKRDCYRERKSKCWGISWVSIELVLLHVSSQIL